MALHCGSALLTRLPGGQKRGSLLLIPLLLVSMAHAGEPGEEMGGVALYTNFQYPMPDPVFQAMRAELDWLISPLGIQFMWRSTAHAASYPPSNMLAVTRFKGRCDTMDLRVIPNFRWKLGWSHVVDGRVLPFADIFCDAIRSYLAPGLALLEPAKRDAVFGRAVSRVVAHELYHIFAETRKHGVDGFAGACYSCHDLLADQFAYRGKELQKLRSALAPAALRPNWTSRPSPGRSVFVEFGCVGCHGAHADGTSKGPGIVATRLPRNGAELRKKLTNSASPMSRRARELSLDWTSLGSRELSHLLQFLQSTDVRTGP